MPGIDLYGSFSVLLVATVKPDYDLAKLDIESRGHSVLKTLSLPYNRLTKNRYLLH